MDKVKAHSNLGELSKEELGELFPVIIVNYKPEWADLFIQEKGSIECLLAGHPILRLLHMGSTSVPGLPAKPTIDILLEVDRSANIPEIICVLEGDGYYCIHRPDKPPPNYMFAKGYSFGGYLGQAYHVHLRYPGDWDELYFCEYLRRHRNVAKEYAVLKQDLAQKYRHDRESYTKAKSLFIKEITSLARESLIL